MQKEKVKIIFDNDAIIEKEMSKAEKLFNRIKSNPIPATSIAVSLFAIKTTDLKESIFQLIGKGNLHSISILHRALLEQDLKFQYIFHRYISEKSDLVGEDYLIHCFLSEAIDYAAAWANIYNHYQRLPPKDPFQLLEKLQPALKKYTKLEIKEKAAKFKYRNIIRYLHSQTFKNTDSEFDFLISFADYSKFSSSVHGGPMMDFDLMHKDEEGINSFIMKMAEEAFFKSSGVKLFCCLVWAQIEPKIFKHFWNIKYRISQILYEEVKSIKMACELEIGDVILFKRAPLKIDDIDLEFINEEVSKKYSDDVQDVRPEDTLYTFYCFTEVKTEITIEAKHNMKFTYLGNKEMDQYFFI